ncbi:TetR/AcrR family transcriptional regulator [Plectonema cf. radiosum LEGE 06105]|uniref:TetR/AcrR family transcriptional regulator n=1 Tax=Plectonema cf. radiosum LEGE 06105 TaxID=945769 RepID=A0A8J7K2V7_9CYAN|nr:TetR/AcrR family transcriptional regulator [Plectonema radiosum]MBE9214777.1 TetR/AcrR family transcriptional regulator [Plectonema cf. radiosum LEGE 06105]
MEKSRARYHHGNLREELLRATGELLETKGLEAISMRAIARHIGVSHGAPANHFANKEALMTAYVAQAFEDAVQSVENACQQVGDDLEKRFLAVGQAIVNFAIKNPNTFKLMIRSEWFDSKQVDVAIPRRKMFDILLNHIEAMDLVNGAPAQSAQTRAIAAWAMIQGYASLRIEGVLVAGKDEKTGDPREVAAIKAYLHGAILSSPQPHSLKYPQSAIMIE